ncbi:MAG: hypothetical protein BJ554DRAFT_3979, partial [Olpidium bornovanus]
LLVTDCFELDTEKARETLATLIRGGFTTPSRALNMVAPRMDLAPWLVSEWQADVHEAFSREFADDLLYGHPDAEPFVDWLVSSEALRGLPRVLGALFYYSLSTNTETARRIWQQNPAVDRDVALACAALNLDSIKFLESELGYNLAEAVYCLLCACEAKRPECVAYLLEKGADLKFCFEPDPDMPGIGSWGHCGVDVARIFHECGMVPSSYDLFDAVLNMDLALARYLVKLGADPHADNLLMLAVGRWHGGKPRHNKKFYQLKVPTEPTCSELLELVKAVTQEFGVSCYFKTTMTLEFIRQRRHMDGWCDCIESVVRHLTSLGGKPLEKLRPSKRSEFFKKVLSCRYSSISFDHPWHVKIYDESQDGTRGELLQDSRFEYLFDRHEWEDSSTNVDEPPRATPASAGFNANFKVAPNQFNDEWE